MDTALTSATWAAQSLAAALPPAHARHILPPPSPQGVTPHLKQLCVAALKGQAVGGLRGAMRECAQQSPSYAGRVWVGPSPPSGGGEPSGAQAEGWLSRDNGVRVVQPMLQPPSLQQVHCPPRPEGTRQGQEADRQPGQGLDEQADPGVHGRALGPDKEPAGIANQQTLVLSQQPLMLNQQSPVGQQLPLGVAPFMSLALQGALCVSGLGGPAPAQLSVPAPWVATAVGPAQTRSSPWARPVPSGLEPEQRQGGGNQCSCVNAWVPTPLSSFQTKQ